jgi:adenosylcobinamide kinase/adenosylcobinamide-phosphate guanylyltransferase
MAAAELALASQITILLEDLTLLVSNLMAEDGDRAEARAQQELEEFLELAANLIIVSNEVGMGIVPAYPSGRLFRDVLGRLNQRAAAACSEVHLLVAGLPLRLK